MCEEYQGVKYQGMWDKGKYQGVGGRSIRVWEGIGVWGGGV